MKEKYYELVKSRCMYCGHYDFAEIFYNKDNKVRVCCVTCYRCRPFRIDGGD